MKEGRDAEEPRWRESGRRSPLMKKPEEENDSRETEMAVGNRGRRKRIERAAKREESKEEDQSGVK